MSGTSLVVVLVVLCAAFFIIVQQYSYQLERSTLAYRVLTSYQAVSDHTYRKFNAMSTIVAQGTIDDLQARYANKQSLRDALARVRQNIAAELAHIDEPESVELNHLVKIERLSDRIILGSQAIQEALQKGDPGKALEELTAMRSDKVAGEFSRLIDVALAEERHQVLEAEQATADLSEFVNRALSILLVIGLFIGCLLIYIISKGLTRSITILEKSASAYTSGNFDHRIESLPEKEFEELGHALNRMAEELSLRRDSDKQSKQELETIVARHTRTLRQTNTQLEKSAQDRKRLLADISHELRTPLTIIQGESELALRGDTKTADEYQEALIRIREQSIHTTRLVEDLLFVARAEADHAALDRRSVAIATLLKDVTRDFFSVAEARQVTIAESYEEEQAVVFADARRIKQVISILLDNAIRYSNEAGTVTVSLRIDQDRVVLTVEDKGIGLTEEEAEQVFTRFYRGDSAKRHTQGSGLGLPVAKAIVEAHEGIISLRGKPDQGTTAEVVLPIERELRAVT